MHILERFVCGKHSDYDCEDGIVVTDNLILVVDGATAKRKGTFDGVSPGVFAKKSICNFVV